MTLKSWMIYMDTIYTQEHANSCYRKQLQERPLKPRAGARTPSPPPPPRERVLVRTPPARVGRNPGGG